MARRVFTSNEIDLPYEKMIALKNEGKLQLGIDDRIAEQLSTHGILPDKATKAAFTFWNAITLIVIIVSIYFSFTSNWWWFIPGLIVGYIIAKSNRSGNSENILELAQADPEFYEKVRISGGWLYQMDE